MSNHTRAHFIAILLVGLVFATTGAWAQGKQRNADREEWIQLFNGKNLDGWVVKLAHHELGDNFGDTFRVENGVMKVSYDKYKKFNGEFGHIFYRQKFSHYRLRVEYRFLGEQVEGGPEWGLRNSGAMIHCLAPETMTKDQDFPISIEVQFLGGLGKGPRPTANLCTPGTNVVMDGKLFTPHCINSTSKTYDGDQWVTVEVEVRGDESIKHIVEGKTVIAYEKPQIGGGNVNNFDPGVKKDGAPLTEGYISLQAESHPLEFRKAELLNLSGCMDPKARNYRRYYVHADNSTCKF